MIEVILQQLVVLRKHLHNGMHYCTLPTTENWPVCMFLCYSISIRTHTNWVQTCCSSSVKGKDYLFTNIFWHWWCSDSNQSPVSQYVQLAVNNQTHWAIFHFSHCSTTGVTTMVCVILTVGKKDPQLLIRKSSPWIGLYCMFDAK